MAVLPRSNTLSMRHACEGRECQREHPEQKMAVVTRNTEERAGRQHTLDRFFGLAHKREQAQDDTSLTAGIQTNDQQPKQERQHQQQQMQQQQLWQQHHGLQTRTTEDNFANTDKTGTDYDGGGSMRANSDPTARLWTYAQVDTRNG